MDSPGWSPWFIPQLLQSHHRRIKLATSQGLDDANLFPRCFPGGGCPLSTAVRKIASGSRRRRTVEDRGRSSELKRCCFLNYGGDTTQCYSIYPGSLLYIYSIVIGFPYVYPVLTQSQFYMKVSEALHPQHEMLVTCTTSFVAMEVLPSTFTFTMTCGESFWILLDVTWKAHKHRKTDQKMLKEVNRFRHIWI